LIRVAELTEGFYEQLVHEVESVRVCYKQARIASECRFIPSNKPRQEEINSTRVRKLIEDNLPSGQLLKELRKLVLSPVLLMYMIEKREIKEADYTLHPEQCT